MTCIAELREVTDDELIDRICHTLRLHGGMSASNLAHRISSRDEYPITHERIYAALVSLEAEGAVAVAGGYRPYWTLTE